MIKTNKSLLLIFASVLLLITASGAFSLPANYSGQSGDSKKQTDQIQRTVTNVFDFQKNTVSNIEFFTTNYGIFGLDIANNIGGGKWPRGSFNQYIFGGGIWFGAMKKRPNSEDYKKYVEITYNPNNGRSWMVPGVMSPNPDDHSKDLLEETDIFKYRLYFSTDYRAGDGKDLSDGTYIWPLWDDLPYPDTLKNNRYFGHYIDDNGMRNTTSYPKGPAYISEEDIFSAFKDTDLRYYDGGKDLRAGEGYPLRLQFESYIYSWSFGQYKDFIFLRYDIMNNSKDTLLECWMAPAMDIDIARVPNTQAGASNDRVRYYDEDEGMNLAMQWTNGEYGEAGKGFGYLGFNFLESPAVDQDGFVRKDKRFFLPAEQIGLQTFRNWVISDDLPGDDQRYNFMASRRRDGDDGPGDKRFLMATGPFNMRPKDTVRVIVGVILATPSVKDDPDGSTADVAGLVERTKFAQSVYDNNFRAPAPPDRASMKWTALNNAVRITWDSTSELSEDKYENGLGFLGYKLFRARRTDLDTFDVNTMVPTTSQPLNKGPFGWKQIAQWAMPTPFNKSVVRAGQEENNTNYTLIDSLRLAGVCYKVDSTGQTVIDKYKVRVIRVGKGVVVGGPEGFLMKQTGGYDVPLIFRVDTSVGYAPWGSYFAAKTAPTDFPIFANPYTNYDTDINNFNGLHRLLREDLLGTVTLNPALLSYNPLYWRKETTALANPADTSTLADKVGDTINLKNTYRWMQLNGVSSIVYDRMIPLDVNKAFQDSLNVRQALDSIYQYMKKPGLVKVSFPQMESSKEVRNIISDYMGKITDNRTFVDIGDDEGYGTVMYNDDPTKTRKLLNNIDYYYKLLSYDEGDYTQPTNRKSNNATPGLPNFINALPRAAEVGNLPEFEVTYVDSARIGGLYNFKFFSTDNDRVAQLFAGHDLELEFQPQMLLVQMSMPSRTDETEFGIYLRRMILRDLTSGITLFDSTTFFEETPCRYQGWGGVEQMLTENGASFYGGDSLMVDTLKGTAIDMGLPYSKMIVNRYGKITTGDYTTPGQCYAVGLKSPAAGSIGFSFNYSLQQWGGKYRPDSTTINVPMDGSPVAQTPINFKDAELYDPTIIYTTQYYDFQQWYTAFITNTDFTAFGYSPRGVNIAGTFNNGPADFKVTFQTGGFERMTLSWGLGANKKTNTFNVPYLTMKVENVINYNIMDENNKTLKIDYPGEITHMFIDTIPETYYPTPLNASRKWIDQLDKYNLSSYGWVNGRGENTGPKMKAQQTYLPNFLDGTKNTNIGTQGRYYLSCKSEDGVDQIDFTNVFQASGVVFAFDYANKGRKHSVPAEWFTVPVANYSYGKDFAEGDTAHLKTSGGALGLPLPGAKVKVHITDAKPADNKITDNMMEQVKVVPNPYYITHQGQRSPYDAKIYFTKLPRKCTIEIYTINGDLVRTLNHDETNAQNVESVEVWDLLSSNNQRAQSQTLVAVITDDGGAKSVKQFTIVVGGFRLIQD